MTIAITLALNDQAAEIQELDGSFDVSDLLDFLGLPADSYVTINNELVADDAPVSHADFVQISYDAQEAAQALGQVYASGAPTGPVAGMVLFINNDGGGFADSVPFAAGTTLEGFLAGRGVSTQDKLVRLNNGIVDAGHLLQNGDKISVTPLKVEGAVDTIKVLYINNDGAGFASNVEAIAGVTLQQFLAQQTSSVEGMLVRLNNDIAAGTTPLKNGDKISVTPLKVEGAV